MPDREQRPLPAHVTTPLLTLVTARSLDEDYAHVAARRALDPGASVQRKPGVATVLAVLAFGLLTAVVLVQTERRAEVDELSRGALIDQIMVHEKEASALQDTAATVSREVQTLTEANEGLGEDLAEAQQRVIRLGVRTGFAAVQGPGIRITVDNAPGADATTEIRDEDLATLVDALWQAGAEAIAINGERINVLGGIRNTNRAVHINGNPITAPYVVSAIGDRGTLQARLVEASQGQEWFALVNGLGFDYSAQNVDEVRLPAAPMRGLREAVPANVSGGQGTGREATP